MDALAHAPTKVMVDTLSRLSPVLRRKRVGMRNVNELLALRIVKLSRRRGALAGCGIAAGYKPMKVFVDCHDESSQPYKGSGD